MNHRDLADIVRAKIRDGALPSNLHTRLFAGNGTGQPCSCCGRVIPESEIGYDLYDDPLSMAAWIMHATCYNVWFAELLDMELQSRRQSRADTKSA